MKNLAVISILALSMYGCQTQPIGNPRADYATQAAASTLLGHYTPTGDPMLDLGLSMMVGQQYAPVQRQGYCAPMYPGTGSTQLRCW